MCAVRCAVGVRNVRELRPAVPYAARDHVLDLSELRAPARRALAPNADGADDTDDAGRRAHGDGGARALR